MLTLHQRSEPKSMAKGPLCHFFSFNILRILRILAEPNKAVLCNSPILIVTPCFSSHASNLLLTTLCVPTTTIILLLLLLFHKNIHILQVIKDSENKQLFIGDTAHLVEHCIGIKEIMVEMLSMPEFSRPYFSTLAS